MAAVARKGQDVRSSSHPPQFQDARRHILVTHEMVRGMNHGSVIVDLAAELAAAIAR